MFVAEALRQNVAVSGTMLRVVHNPAVTAIAKHAGFDFVMLDLEHGAYTMADVANMAVAARAQGIALLTRVPANDRAYVSRVLDCGASGVMMPMLETKAQAEALVHHSKFVPIGGRGLASTGGHSMFRPPRDVVQFMAQCNRETLTIAQIETVSGVHNAREIAAVPGIDALVIGPNDLAVSLGKPGELTCPEEEAAIRHVADVCQECDKAFGMHAGTELLERWRDFNMTFYMNAIDAGQLLNAMTQVNRATQRLIESQDKLAQAV